MIDDFWLRYISHVKYTVDGETVQIEHKLTIWGYIKIMQQYVMQYITFWKPHCRVKKNKKFLFFILRNTHIYDNDMSSQKGNQPKGIFSYYIRRL